MRAKATQLGKHTQELAARRAEQKELFVHASDYHPPLLNATLLAFCQPNPPHSQASDVVPG